MSGDVPAVARGGGGAAGIERAEAWRLLSTLRAQDSPGPGAFLSAPQDGGDRGAAGSHSARQGDSREERRTRVVSSVERPQSRVVLIFNSK